MLFYLDDFVIYEKNSDSELPKILQVLRSKKLLLLHSVKDHEK